MNDDRQIIDQALGIWIACIVSNPRLLKEIFQDESKQLVPESSFTKILIEDGLLCVNLGVRVLFKNAIKVICESVGTQSLTDKPFIYFLRIMLTQVSITDNKSKESKQFYQLLSYLLQLYLDAKRAG